MGFSIFESGMLLCFGLAWPINIYKSIKSKSTKGKSGLFLIVILLGYISGITHKILFSQDIVLILYVVNATMVVTDIILFSINRRREAREGAQRM